MIRTLMQDWLIAKEAEQEWNAKRLNIEVELYKLTMEKVEIKKEGTTNFSDDGIKLTITSRMNISVDQEKAAENPDLFVTKYEYSKTKCKNMTDEMISVVQDIITVKPGKPTFNVSVL